VVKRILFLDVALVAVLVMGALKANDDWKAFESIHQVSAVQPQQEAFPVIPLNSTPAETAAADWSEIAALNPFSFDRNDVAILKPVAPPVPAGPKPILFGTMSLGFGPVAMLAPGQPGNRDYQPVKAGEVVDGWKVVEIQPKAVIVESNGVRETVIMNDPTARVPRAAAQGSAGRNSAPAPVIVPNAPPAGAATGPATPGTRRVTIQTPFGVVVREEPIQ
jgi:hypothetical protein